MTDPEHQLAEAERHYQAGDFRTARTLCRDILASDAPEPARKRADEILAATGVDPAAIAAFVLSIAILIYLVVHYLL